MKISVITGSFNHAKQLPKLLKSLTLQRDFLHEWLICDDGSTDKESINLLKEYESLPMVKVFRQENKGMRLAKSLNNGLRAATGDVMFFVMGDSYLEPNTLQTIKDTYIRDTAGSGIRRNVNNDGSFHSWDWRYEEGIPNKISLPKEGYKYLTGNSMIAKLEHLKEIGYWPEDYEGYGLDDGCVFLRLERMGVPLIAYNRIIINHVYHKPVEGVSVNFEKFNKELHESN